MRILVTGAAGFIGFHVSKRLLEMNFEVYGIDNLNDYYDRNLKFDRLEILKNYDKFQFQKTDIKDLQDLDEVFSEFKPEIVINLAAQAGVRYSIENPHAYVESNLVGFVNVLEMCRNYSVKHLIYASSSSVYGGNEIVPFSTKHNVDHPVSLYAATKKSNELMAHTYSHLYNIHTTGLRFFTVYGPFGRPDMAYFSFTKSIMEDKQIKVYNYGNMERDFTYIDDIVEGIVKLMERKLNNNSSESDGVPYEVYNIGNSKPVRLIEFIEVLESLIGKKADKEYLEMQPGDVLRTFADISELENEIGFKPTTDIKEGLEKFVEWFKNYYC